MESTSSVTSASLKSFSRWLIGRMRQKTRMDPLRSSRALWSLRRSPSASRSAAEGTSTALAASKVLKSSSFASSKASMLFRSTSFHLATTLATSFLIMARCCSCASTSSAAANSDSVNCALRAFSMASSSAVRSSKVGPWSPALLTFESCAARRSRASCFGASTSQMACAAAMTSASTLASFACCKLNVKDAMFFDSMAFFNAASAASLDSDACSNAWKGANSAAGKLAVVASAIAARSALAPLA
mmetsp:Transcript_33592/g.77509  ORF Transcript_33592/g.77509 Transcript_33592/m.77509 type:complete len:245 (-) Transcript_33592:1640-2374(-)